MYSSDSETIGGYATEESHFEFRFNLTGTNIFAPKNELTNIEALGLFAANNSPVIDSIVVNYPDGTWTKFVLNHVSG